MFGVTILWTTVAFGQEAMLTAKCSRTTVGLNEQFRITFSTDRRGGKIEPPTMNDFLIVGGALSITANPDYQWKYEFSEGGQLRIGR